MKAILKYWIWCAAVIVVLFAGCAEYPATNYVSPSDFFGADADVSINGGLAYSRSAKSIGSLAPDELWVVERDSEKMVNLAAPLDSGTFLAKVRDGEVALPLSHTDVKASMVGYIGTVEVKQQFENPYVEKIEATYAFPLPRNAAIDEFVMTIGKRRIRGIIRESKEAKAIYEQAKRQGYRATLLMGQRSNTFKQLVANIEPGKEIDVDIKYFQTLGYQDGWFEWVFSMGRRGVETSLRVDVDAGAVIQDVVCKTHAISKTTLSPQHVLVQLKPQDSVHEGDFVLRYRLAEGQTQSRLLTHWDERGGFFSLLLFLPKEVGNPTQALTNIKIDWGAMGVSEVFPNDVPDLISGQPTILTGRFRGTTNGTIRVTGNSSGRPVQFEVPASSAAVSNNALPNLWARMKVADLEERLSNAPTAELAGEIRQVALDYGIVSPFTSFMAVDASEATEGSHL